MSPRGPFLPRVALGVDPGGDSTGFAVRAGDRVLAHAVVARDGDETGPRGLGIGPPRPGSYLSDVAETLAELAAEHDPDVVGIEGLVKPNPHANRRNGSSIIDVRPLLATALVLGHLAARCPAAVWVPPGGHGSLLLAAYPAELITPGERRHGLNRAAPQNTPLRHARSAYDVAGAASLLARLRASQHAGTQPG